MSKKKIFADGFSFNTRENQPEFVVGKVSVKIEDAIPFLKEHGAKRGWVNLNILIGRSGKPYIELDTYEPKSKNTQSKSTVEADEDLPF